MSPMKTNRLDHLAIAVENTDKALLIWRDKFGLPVLYSEKVQNDTVKLTHLNLGNTHLQLVEPLTLDHPLKSWLKENGSGLHHFCLGIENIEDTIERCDENELKPMKKQLHQATQGRKAFFIDEESTDGLLVEISE